MRTRNESLASALAALNAELDGAGIDLGRSFHLLAGVVRSAVASYCGMSITVIAEGMPVTITAPEDGGASSTAAAASLVIPLPAIAATALGELVFFASTEGAFVDLAADLAYETVTELVAFAVDTRLAPTGARSVDVAGSSLIHQAIGVLVDQGCTPEQARARIVQLAAQDGHDLVAAAERIVKREQHW